MTDDHTASLAATPQTEGEGRGEGGLEWNWHGDAAWLDPIRSASKIAAWIPMTPEVLADFAGSWQGRAVILGESDPNPMPPRFHLFARTGRA